MTGSYVDVQWSLVEPRRRAMITLSITAGRLIPHRLMVDLGFYHRGKDTLSIIRGRLTSSAGNNASSIAKEESLINKGGMDVDAVTGTKLLLGT